jgi:hypothetical protein
MDGCWSGILKVWCLGIHPFATAATIQVDCTSRVYVWANELLGEKDNVSSLTLDLTLPLGKHKRPPSISHLCKYLKQCKGVRQVHILIQWYIRCEDVVTLFQVLCQATRMQELGIIMKTWYTPMCLFPPLPILHSHPSLRKLVISGFYSSPNSARAINQVSSFLRSTICLESLEFKESSMNMLDIFCLLQGLRCCLTLVRLNL